MDANRALDDVLDQYLIHWGPVSWRQELSVVALPPNVQLGRIVLALSAIETDSRQVYRKLHIANLDRRRAIQEFNISWLAEEVEHGRALRCLAEKLGVTDLPPKRSSRKSMRAAIAWPALAASRVFGAPMEAAYLSMGVIQEHIALTTYRKVAELIGHPQAASVLRAIAAQEGRHMRFYHCAAQIFLDDPKCAFLVASLFRRFWRPPGVDLLGLRVWLTTFAPLLADDDYRDRLLKVDEIMRTLPGLSGTSYMLPFLTRHGYRPAISQEPDDRSDQVIAILDESTPDPTSDRLMTPPNR
jgi:hypothetical protein